MDADSYVLQALGYKWAEFKKKKQKKKWVTLYFTVSLLHTGETGKNLNILHKFIDFRKST